MRSLMIALATGASPGALGSAHPLSAPYQAFETEDGWINVGASNQGTWLRLTQALDLTELAADERFETNAARMTNLRDLIAEIAPTFKTRSSDAWLSQLAAGGVPAGPIASVGEMLEHPQTAARDMVIEVDHTKLGRVHAIGNPVKLDGAPSTSSRGAPLCGQD